MARWEAEQSSTHGFVAKLLSERTISFIQLIDLNSLAATFRIGHFDDAGAAPTSLAIDSGLRLQIGIVFHGVIIGADFSDLMMCLMSF